MAMQQTQRTNDHGTMQVQSAGERNQRAIERCVEKLLLTMPIIGLRNPRIGRPDLTWDYCSPFSWVVGFHVGQLWLALQLTGDSRFLNAAQARRSVFRDILAKREAQDHDLGMQFSLSCVAEWQMTGNAEARQLAIEAACRLIERFHQDGEYIQAWNVRSVYGSMPPEFVNGRTIADTMQNLALLYWAGKETGRRDFSFVADSHAETARKHLIRPDDTSFHTFLFDASTGKPLRGETFQGYAHDSCWSRGQAWLIHGFAQTGATTGNPVFVEASRRLAIKAEALMGADTVPRWDYDDPDRDNAPLDSSAGAIMAAGVFLLADLCEPGEAVRWRHFGNRLLGGLIDHCDVTNNPNALGMLDHGASFVREGYSNTMLPYGDYYFMEALLRSLGHSRFFW